MSDHRKPSATLMLKKPGKTGLKIEVFFASDFGQEDAEGYRLRVDGRWLGPEKSHVADLHGLGEYLAARVGGVLGVAPTLEQGDDELPTDIPAGTRVSVMFRDDDDIVSWYGSWTKAKPIQCKDGKWRVPVTMPWGEEYVLLRSIVVQHKKQKPLTDEMTDRGLGRSGVKNHE